MSRWLQATLRHVQLVCGIKYEQYNISGFRKKRKVEIVGVYAFRIPTGDSREDVKTANLS